MIERDLPILASCAKTACSARTYNVGNYLPNYLPNYLTT